MASDQLLYFRELRTKTEFAGWGLQWNKEVPETCHGPDGYQRYFNKRVKLYKTYGTTYLEKAVLKMRNVFYPDILRNLSPYKELPIDVVKKEGVGGQKKTGAVILTKEENK